MCIADRRKITSVLTGLVKLEERAVTKPVGPGLDGSEPAIRWKGIKQSGGTNRRDESKKNHER